MVVLSGVGLNRKYIQLSTILQVSLDIQGAPPPNPPSNIKTYVED